MFEKIGQFSSKYRYPIIVLWAAVLVVTLIFAPNLSDVSISDQSGWLSDEAPSNVAEAIAREYFPDQVSAGQAVLVIESENGSVKDDRMQAYITELTDWLESDLDPGVINEVLSPTDPDMADQLTSEDERAVMIFVGLNGSEEDTATAEAMDAMQEKLNEAPEGYRGYVTGNDAIIRDYKNSALESVDRTTIITILLVVTILLIIYRSPVSPLVPLITIGVSYLISRGLVASLTIIGYTITSITDVLLVVLLFGAGTDYCLFIVSRYREYMADNIPVQESARKTIAHVGETIASSAGTVIVGMIAMSFVELSVVADAGPSLAIGVVIALLAGLTLTPALLTILGRFAFWPGGPRHADGGAFWGRLAGWVTERPWLPLILSAITLIPLAIYSNGQQRNYDLLADLPDEVPARAGFLVLNEHFDPGEMQPLDVVVLDVPNPHSPEGMAYIDTLTRDLMAQEGVANVRSLTLPAGREEPEVVDMLRVSKQLDEMAAGMDRLNTGTIDPEMMADVDVDEVLAGLQVMRDYLDELAGAFPDVESNADYQAAYGALDELEVNIEQLNNRLLVTTQLEEVITGFTQEESPENADIAMLSDIHEQLAILNEYLVGLEEAQPEIAETESYQAVLIALTELETDINTIEDSLLLTVQLTMLSEQFAEMGEAVSNNPMSLMPQPGQPSAGEQMAALVLYMEELGTEYPELAATEDYQVALAMLQAMSVSFETIDISQAGALIAQAEQALPVLSDRFAGLAETTAQTMPDAVFVPQTALPGSEVYLENILADVDALETALQDLHNTVESEYPDATYIPSAPSLAEEMLREADDLLAEGDTLQTALEGLSVDFENREDNFFIPFSITEGEDLADLNRLLDIYSTTEHSTAIRLQVILADNPFSLEAQTTTARLREQLKDGSSAYISGGTATQLDLQEAMARDMKLIVILVLGGISVVLVLLLRSLVAPIYMIATILLSYSATLGLVRLVFECIFDRGLTWWVPVFMFVMLVALGMDYNIFLMGRVKEEIGTHGTKAGIRHAVERTGGIITSAGIIMAGTFAAMMASSLTGLVQIAFAIAVGILLDTFIIRTTLVPAIATLLDKWNWWPGKEPTK